MVGSEKEVSPENQKPEAMARTLLQDAKSALRAYGPTRARPCISLRFFFNDVVLRPIVEHTEHTPEGYADPAWLVAQAFRQLRSDPERWPLRIVRKPVFIQDKRDGWMTAHIAFGNTDREKQMIYALHVLGLALKLSDVVVAGVREPKTHDRAVARIPDEWWDEEIKVDFAKGELFARDPATDNWRLMFSEIRIWRADDYRIMYETAPIADGGEVSPTSDSQPSKQKKRKGTIAAETECRRWLRKQVKDNKKQVKKVREYREEAQKLFDGLSSPSFKKVWKEECIKKGWTKRGRWPKSSNKGIDKNEDAA